jgi:hypothetical protein
VLDDEEYTREELEDLNTWIPWTHHRLPEWPFKFYFAKLKSDSPELNELIKDPKAVLQNGYESLPALSEQNTLIGEDTRVTTTIFGHDRSLKARMAYAIVALDAQDNSASMTTYKASSLPPSG